MKNPHPAPYPIKLPLRCIQGIMQEKGVILDPYSGSGTTGLAAKLLGHDYIGLIYQMNIMTWQEKDLIIHLRMI